LFQNLQDLSADLSEVMVRSNAKVAPDNDICGTARYESAYGGHVAAVCEAMNAAVNESVPEHEIFNLQKRRATNRLSARRCRKRRKEEVEKLEAELRSLSSEHERLNAENENLKLTLREEIAKSCGTVIPSTQGHGLLQQQPHVLSSLVTSRHLPSYYSLADRAASVFQGIMPNSLSSLQGIPSQIDLYGAATSLGPSSLATLLFDQNTNNNTRTRLALLSTDPSSQSRNQGEMIPSGIAGIPPDLGSSLSFPSHLLYSRNQHNPSTQQASQPIAEFLARTSSSSFSPGATREAILNAASNGYWKQLGSE
jgi:hypothetical protein